MEFTNIKYLLVSVIIKYSYLCFANNTLLMENIKWTLYLHAIHNAVIYLVNYFELF